MWAGPEPGRAHQTYQDFSICFQSHRKSLKPKQAVRISFSFHVERRLGGGKSTEKEHLGSSYKKLGKK